MTERGRTPCSGKALQMTVALEKPSASNKHICTNTDVRISWSTISHYRKLTERKRKDACRKIARPTSQHKNQSKTTGGWHSRDYLEAKSIIDGPNKKLFWLISLQNLYHTNTFRLLSSHCLVIMPRVLLQASSHIQTFHM